MIFNPVVSIKKKSKLPQPGKPLDDYTWEEIAAVSDAGLGADYWAIGDAKMIHIEGTVGTKAYNNDYAVFIIDFDHDGDGRITFGGFKTAATGGIDICLTDGDYSSISTNGRIWFNMNHGGNYNHGGWAACDLRYDILGSTDQKPDNYNATKTAGNKGYDASETTATKPVDGTLMAALPEELRKYMKPMTVYTDNVAGNTNVQANVTATVDYLPLLAEWEIFGKRTYANSYEQNFQTQYTYYANSNPTIKYRDSANGTAAYWWGRSPRYSNAINFCYVDTSGGANSYFAYYSRGLAPAFKI